MIECFKIQLLSFDNEEEIFNIKKGKRIFGVYCLKPYFKANPTIIVADPFLFEYKVSYICFMRVRDSIHQVCS